MELALWFHDAIYDAISSTNEVRSAEWATEFLRSANIADERSSRVATHILATRHSAEPLYGDAALVVSFSSSARGCRMTQLVSPSSGLERSHAAYVRELVDRGERFVPYVLAEVGDSFAEYVSRLAGYSRGIGLPAGHVHSSTFWLLDDADEIAAVSNLRHSLTKFLSSYGGHIGFGVRPSARRRGYATEVLRLTLIEARKLGISEVLVTCDKDNQASARTILRNGGVLDSEEYMEAHATIVQRYRIPNL